MSYDDELTGLKLRLVTDPDRRDLVERRIGEVEAAIKESSPAPVIETAVAPEPEMAVIKKAAPKKATRQKG